MFIDDITIYLDVNPNLCNHVIVYPFFAPRCRELLQDRGVQITGSPRQAHYIIQALLPAHLSGTLPFKLISEHVPTILVESRDDSSVHPLTRSLLNKYSNTVLWKWGLYVDSRCYEKSAYCYVNISTGLEHDTNHYEAFDLNRIKLAYGFLWHHIGLCRYYQSVLKQIDVSFVGTIWSENNSSSDFKIWHRMKCVEATSKLPYVKVVSDNYLSRQEYSDILNKSKICISPFGNCELCGRDSEALMHDCVVVRPQTNNLITWPNIWADHIECDTHFENLPIVIENILDNWPTHYETAVINGEKWRAVGDNLDMLVDRIYNLLIDPNFGTRYSEGIIYA
jgi:hypothetical protein